MDAQDTTATQVIAKVVGQGHDENGRFAKGNTLGHGSRAHLGAIAKLRSVIFERATPLKMGRVVDTLIAKAQDGDMRAIDILLDRVLGKATQHIEVAHTAVESPDQLMKQIAIIVANQPELRYMVEATPQSVTDDITMISQ